VNPAADTAAICESFGYEAFIVQRGEKIAALPAIAQLTVLGHRGVALDFPLAVC
jgi:hypothetical protein